MNLHLELQGLRGRHEGAATAQEKTVFQPDTAITTTYQPSRQIMLHII
jgi:hypothetical protein